MPGLFWAYFTYTNNSIISIIISYYYETQCIDEKTKVQKTVTQFLNDTAGSQTYIQFQSPLFCPSDIEDGFL